MRRPIRSKDQRPQAGFLLASKSGFRHYRWVVPTVACALVVGLVFLIDRAGAAAYPLPALGAVIVTISAITAALSGVLAGLASALAGALAALLLVADFSSRQGRVNALVSAVFWCAAAIGTGLISRRLRGQVAQREAALQKELSRSLSTKDLLERVLDLSPVMLQGKTLAEVARTACESALRTFGVDGARVFRLQGDKLELLAICPPSRKIRPGYTLATADFPDLGLMMAQHRPLFVRQVGATRPTGRAEDMRQALNIVSTVRLPIVGPRGPEGLLSLSWCEAVDRPDEDMLLVMQRFADQLAIAWHNALRLEAQRRADGLHRTLERAARLAPTFHINGSREVVAGAICRAALATFGCAGAALYRVEPDRLTLLERRPSLESMAPGRAFPLTAEMPLVREIRALGATFVPDVSAPSRAMRPWPEEVVRQAGTRSALYVPLRYDEQGPANLLVLTWKKQRAVPDERLLVIAQRFADQAALALAHSSAERLHARLEASLLPTAPVYHPLLRVTTRYRTGEQRLRLGGDFVGSVAVDDSRLAFVIGDVSGHGPDAAALGATLRSTWKALALAGQSLPKTAAVMTELIQGERRVPNSFATVLLGTVDMDKRLISWINAGHLPPLLIANNVSPLDSKPTPPLGIGRDIVRKVSRAPLPTDWSLFCYTDGLIDARVAPGSAERYGESRLKQTLSQWVGTAPDAAALDALIQRIEADSGSRFADDVAVLLISTKAKRVGAKT